MLCSLLFFKLKKKFLFKIWSVWILRNFIKLKRWQEREKGIKKVDENRNKRTELEKKKNEQNRISVLGGWSTSSSKRNVPRCKSVRRCKKKETPPFNYSLNYVRNPLKWYQSWMKKTTEWITSFLESHQDTDTVRYLGVVAGPMKRENYF